MQQLGDERVLFAFARDLEPALTVESGETVRIRTKDCFGNQVRTSEDALDEIDWDAINPATGPVFVKGARPGGALKVVIENIELDRFVHGQGRRRVRRSVRCVEHAPVRHQERRAGVERQAVHSVESHDRRYRRCSGGRPGELRNTREPWRQHG